MNVIKLLKQPFYALIAMGVAFLLFDLNYYFMTKLPGTRDFQRVLGAGFTPANIIFSVILSLMAGLLVVGMMENIKKRKASKLAGGASSVGVVAGAMTVFCTFCTLPVISVFGLSVSIAFFTTYEWYFKGLSLILMAVGLWLLDRQLVDECKVCKD